MNILLLSNFTVQSGYSLQARILVPQLQKLDHHVTVVDIRAGGGSTSQVGNVVILPTVHDALGGDIIQTHYSRSKADIVISLVDVWGLNPDIMGTLNWCPITPIDHSPVPPAVAHSLKAAKGIIALSRFGQRELSNAGYQSQYLPHMVDPAVWYPSLDMTQIQQARAALHLPPDAFLVSFVGVNDSNPSRKGIPELLAAWSIFSRAHPDTILYLHTTPLGNIPVAGARHGVDIDALMNTFGVDKRTILMPDQYRLRTGIPAAELSTMARASNVFVLPSRGEGFGIPLIEFGHAGCPIITTDFAAGAELCASGWLIEGESEWSSQNATVVRPGIASIAEQLEAAYTARDDMRYRVQAATFAREFEVDYVTAKYLAPLMAALSELVVLNARIA